MNVIFRVLAGFKNLLLAAGIFLLFIIGYIFYGIMWALRFGQRRLRLAGVFIFVGSIALFSGLAYYLLFPLHGPHQPVEIVIRPGCSVRGVADSLYRHHVITSRPALIAWVRIARIERFIQAGRYSFLIREGVLSAARRLTCAAPEEALVTIPEGLTIEQTAAKVAAVFHVDTTEFVRLCRDTQFIGSLGLGPVPSLEGYLFPDSYRFRNSAAPAEILRRMTSRFSEACDGLDSARSGAARLSRHEIVTLASIVEKEAKLAEERPRIAAVFYNRLRVGMPLGADPTVRYALKKFDGPLYLSELNSPSPYNTRRNRGLPPGPICSPGLASLAAAVSPDRTNELYFVAKWDGSGGHEFSVTNEEHSRKKIQIRNQNRKRIQHKEDSCRTSALHGKKQ